MEEKKDFGTEEMIPETEMNKEIRSDASTDPSTRMNGEAPQKNEYNRRTKETAPQMNEQTPQTSDTTRQANGDGLQMDEASLQALAVKLASAMNPVKTEEEKRREEEARKAEEAEQERKAKLAAKQKRRKRRLRNFRNFLLRLVLMVVVVYVLFFQLIGVTTMPNGDMYPRIDSGDLVIFYRLDKDVRAQDIIAFTKDVSTLQDYQEKAEAEEYTPEDLENGEETGEVDETARKTQPVPQTPDVAPSAIVADNSILGKVNEFVYKAERVLGLRQTEGKQVFICRVVAAAGDTVEITDAGTLIINGNTMIESNIFSHTTPYVGFTEYPLTLKAGECFVLADKRNGGADSRFFGPVKEEEILGTVITIARRNNL